MKNPGFIIDLWIRTLLILPFAAVLAPNPMRAQPAATPENSDLAGAFSRLTRETPWREASRQTVSFVTHHPQGFARVGDALFFTSVEVIERTARYTEPRDGLDRSTGKGKGHLFKMDLAGNLLADIELGEGSIYHPGGIDFDGTYLWVPVAEYRPNSRSIIYRIDPASMHAEEVFRYPDHIGGLVYNRADGSLHGISWGARRFYRWDLGAAGANFSSERVAGASPRLNPSHYIDYQDCQYAAANQAICSGLAVYEKEDGTRFALGGLELLDLNASLPIHQIPFPFWTERDLPMTQNPMAIELVGDVLRLYLMPEDNQSRLFIFETHLPE